MYSSSRLRRRPQNEDDLKIEDNLNNEDDLKNEDNLKNEEPLKNEYDLKKWRCPKNEDYIISLYPVSLGDPLATAAVQPFFGEAALYKVIT